MEFTCANCGKSFIRLGGWKNHMSRTHGGYDESDIAQVTSGGASSEENVQQRMDAFSKSLQPGQEDAAIPDTVPRENGTVPLSRSGERPPAQIGPPPVKTVKASPKRLKKILASIPETILSNTGITLDEEDKEALEEAGEFLSDIFGVEFEVNQEKKVLHSRFWAIAWVCGVAGLIYCKHRFAHVWQSIYDAYKKRLEENKENV
jgi:hypothetical protein